MESRVALTAVYEPVEGGWVQAHIKEMPGVISAAPTLEKAKEMLADALREYLLSFIEAPAAEPNGGTIHEPLEIVIAPTTQARVNQVPASG